jgi:hypothetical protein
MLAKIIFKSLLLVSSLSAVDVYVKSAVEEAQNYAVLHIKDEEPFECKYEKNDLGEIAEVSCTFDRVPSEQFRESKSQFFDIKTDIFGDKLLITVKNLYKARLYQANFDLKQHDEIDTDNRDSSKHWYIVGFKDFIPYLHKKGTKGINFPVKFSNSKTPHIGGLNLDKEPIFFEKNMDVNYYLDIKQDFQKENYEAVIKTANKALAEYPYSMFARDFSLFEIRSLPFMEDKENELIALAKKWVRDYPADESVPEVLLVIARAYVNLGVMNEAEYYFNRIISEYSDNKFAQLAMIYFGDQKFEHGSEKKAFKLYKEALYTTQDIYTASFAAKRLAQKYLETDNLKESEKYFDKVMNANMAILLEDNKETYNLSKTLAEKGLYRVAKKLGLALLDKIAYAKLNDLYEPLLKDTGYWADRDKDFAKADELYTRYLDEFAFGEYRGFVELRKDNLYFEANKDSNPEELIKRYDELMAEYRGSEIEHKAMFRKLKVLLKLKRYREVLEQKDRLQAIPKNVAEKADKIEILQEASLNYMIEKLHLKDCREAMQLRSEYNITLDKQYDRELEFCASDEGENKLAISIADRNIRGKDLDNKMYWLKRYVKALIKDRDYYRALDIGRDIIDLAQVQNSQKDKDVLYDMFYATKELNRYADMIKIVDEIEATFKDAYRNIEIFKVLTQIGTAMNDDLMTLKYSKKIIDTQKLYSTFTETPAVELLYMQSLVKLSKHVKAIEFSKSIKDIKMSKEDEVRLNYFLGLANQKLEQEEKALKHFTKCVDTELDRTTSWQQLCQDALKLLSY